MALGQTTCSALVAREPSARHEGPCAPQVTTQASEPRLTTTTSATPERCSAREAIRREDADVVPTDDPSDRSLRSLPPAVQGRLNGPIDQGIPTPAVEVNRPDAAIASARPDLTRGAEAVPTAVTSGLADDGVQAPEVGPSVARPSPSYPVLQAVARATNQPALASVALHEERQATVRRIPVETA